MKLLFQLSFLLIANYCSSQEVKISAAQQTYIANFIKSVESHSVKKVFKLLDKTYRKEQNKFLGGNKTQLIDELFSGSDFLTNDFRNIKLADIKKIEVVEVIQLKNGKYNYIFRIKTHEFDILTSLRLNKAGRKYGLIGSVG